MLPSFRRIEPKRDAYLDAAQLIDARKSDAPSRYWHVAGATTSVQQGGRMLKLIDRFGAYARDEETFTALMEDAYSKGVTRPASFSSFFHAKFYTPRMPRSVNALFQSTFTGAWEEAKQIGNLTGLWKQYDLNSAYLWAGSRGLPKLDTLRYVDALNPQYPGLYRIELDDLNLSLPYPFNSRLHVNATMDEIDTYNLRVRKVFGGVTWKESIDGELVWNAVKQFKAWKHVGKAYWGRWCSQQDTFCTSKSGKTWRAPNMAQNFVWAHTVIERVKMKIWDEAKGAAHIFVDSVIVPHDMVESDEVGGWRHEHTFANGVKIKHPGYFGEIGGNWLKTSGEKRAA